MSGYFRKILQFGGEVLPWLDRDCRGVLAGQRVRARPIEPTADGAGHPPIGPFASPR
jgi:hypothetical protein